MAKVEMNAEETHRCRQAAIEWNVRQLERVNIKTNPTDVRRMQENVVQMVMQDSTLQAPDAARAEAERRQR